MTEQSKTRKIRLLVAEDHEIVRLGVRGLLADTEIQASLPRWRPGQRAWSTRWNRDVDVVLMDVRLPDGDGLNALGRIKLDKPELPIFILSTYENPAYIARAVALGANGYLLKGCTRDS